MFKNIKFGIFVFVPDVRELRPNELISNIEKHTVPVLTGMPASSSSHCVEPMITNDSMETTKSEPKIASGIT
jgi:hypothetical protein